MSNASNESEDNPFSDPPNTIPHGSQPASPKQPGNNDSYEVVTDLVAGPNVRFSDNCFQAIFILISTILGAAAGLIYVFWFANGTSVDEAVVWTVGGSFGGLVFGLFASGIFLMVYRALKHIRGG